MTSLPPPDCGPNVPPRGLPRPTIAPLRARRSFRRGFALLALLALTLLSLPALAQTSRPELCEAAAREASASSGVPLSVLRAIMLTVSGRKGADGIVPWPWTIGSGGERVWFETADDARAYAYRQIKSGEPAIGLGCFQVDYAKYGPQFASLEDMLTPRLNAEFAASLLLGLHAQTGGWGHAAAAMHGLEADSAEAWLATFYRYRDTVRDDEALAAGTENGAASPGRPRLNTYPLLRGSEDAQVLGSLVPIAPSGLGPSPFRPATGL